MLPVVILVGGVATRLRPITDSIPKALVPVAGRPFILQQLDYLHNQGISQVVLCTGYRASQIKEIVGDGSCCGLAVRYSDDGDTLLGTGGAVRKALPLLGPEFFVLYGDSFLPVNFEDVENAYLESQQPALMTVYRNQGQWDTSNVVFCEDRVVEYNKFEPRLEMQYIDYGLSILSGVAFDEQVGEEVFDLATLYMTLSKRGELAGFKVCQRFYEIGSPKGLAETEQYFKLMRSA
jgi:NDP-sugar pyrophosphorylase family protein